MSLSTVSTARRANLGATERHVGRSQDQIWIDVLAVEVDIRPRGSDGRFMTFATVVRIRKDGGIHRGMDGRETQGELSHVYRFCRSSQVGQHAGPQE